jgi:predicted phage terminase large subunit-like protein
MTSPPDAVGTIARGPDKTLTVHMPPLHAGQQLVADMDARFKVVCAGRRWGKTRFGVYECLKFGLQGKRAWWVAPTYKLAQEGWHPLRQVATTIPGARVRETDKEVYFPGGGRVGVRSADNPDMLRGAGLDYVVLDEAAYMPERLWVEILRPSLADRQGHALFISTPVGFNWFYDIYERAPTLDSWARFHAPTHDNPYIPNEELDIALEEVGSHVFSQEFLAEFVELGGNIFKTEWFEYFTEMPMERIHEDGTTEERLVWVVNNKIVDPDDCSTFITVDPAVSIKETADYTAMAAVAITPDNQMLVLEMVRRRMEGPDIVPTAAHLSEKWGGGMIYFEKVAFQLLLIQEARRQGLPVGELKADKDKLSRALPLAARMEAGRVHFRKGASWLPDLERELMVFPLDSEHDDQVDALAYAASKMGRQVKWGAY